MKKWNKFSLLELIALYNNYILVDNINAGSAWMLVDEDEAIEIRTEIEKRIDKTLK